MWNLRDGAEDAMDTGVSRWQASRDMGVTDWRCRSKQVVLWSRFRVGVDETELLGHSTVSNSTTISDDVKP